MREITSGNTFKPTPSLAFREAPGTKFKGKRISEVRLINKVRIYEFAAIDGDMPTTIKVGDNQYQRVDVAPGETVVLFATTKMHETLQKTKVGDVLEIEYFGLQATKSGSKWHAHKISVED